MPTIYLRSRHDRSYTSYYAFQLFTFLGDALFGRTDQKRNYIRQKRQFGGIGCRDLHARVLLLATIVIGFAVARKYSGQAPI